MVDKIVDHQSSWGQPFSSAEMKRVHKEKLVEVFGSVTMDVDAKHNNKHCINLPFLTVLWKSAAKPTMAV